MKDENQEFKESLRALGSEILARVEAVGLEQAAEEYWEKTKQDLNAWCVGNEEHRRLNNIPISEL